MTKFIRIILLLLSLNGFSQTWRVLPNSPASSSFRHDDLFFINEDTGWVCNVDGKIYQTTNAGESWKTLVTMPNTSFRCIGFVNAKKGWAGNLGTGRWSPTIDTMPLYETNDGGNTWQAVTNISGILPKGICGINIVNDSVVYAVGRVGGPAYLLKTTNGGASWKSIDMNALAFQLIDCRFFSADTGFVVGGIPGPYSLSKYRILYTTDGGTNWQTMASGIDTGFNCWKIFFVNRNLGYVSLEHEEKSDSVSFLKTTDGGLTWKQNSYFSSNTYGGQGIGFINDTIGWCAFLAGDTRQTLDGGKTWTASTALNALNRMRILNPNLAYAVSNRVWKYSLYPTGVNVPQTNIPEGFTVKAYPNPFADSLIIQYHIPNPGNVSLRVYDFSGRPVNTCYEAYTQEGEHQLHINLTHYFDTHFYIVIKFNEYQVTQKIISKK
jgi:photosystem II stability/assembly factor-like uncharacterized protein